MSSLKALKMKLAGTLHKLQAISLFKQCVITIVKEIKKGFIFSLKFPKNNLIFICQISIGYIDTNVLYRF